MLSHGSGFNFFINLSRGNFSIDFDNFLAPAEKREKSFFFFFSTEHGGR